jgi:deazaflavin-dependent oxidoreductase (nitroreductase family)
MKAVKTDLKDRLSQLNEINITVTGRKSGRMITNPVWFVLEGIKIWLLPVRGSDSDWYKNLLKKPSMQIGAGGEEFEVRPQLVTDANVVKSVVEKFREKYGAGDVKKYYSKFDVAVAVDIAAA